MMHHGLIFLGNDAFATITLQHWRRKIEQHRKLNRGRRRIDQIAKPDINMERDARIPQSGHHAYPNSLVVCPSQDWLATDGFRKELQTVFDRRGQLADRFDYR